MKPIFKISLALGAALPLVALAQPSRPAPAVSGNGGVTIGNAAGGTTTYDDARGLARLTKDVVVVQKAQDIVMYAQEVTYNRIRNQANAMGQLRVETRDSTIRGKMLFADFNSRRATITGNVVITSHGRNDGTASGLRGETLKKPIKVLCDRVDWEYDIKQATATGNISIIQGPNRGTCDSIVYDESRNIINLKGNVRFGDNKKRIFIGQNIMLYVDEGRVFSDSRTRIIIPPGDFDKGPSPAHPSVPKKVTRFGAAPSLPKDVLNDVVAPPPAAPASRSAVAEDPLPTQRPDEPDANPVDTPDPAPTVPPTK